jgi:hypothetical protein
MLMTGEKVMLLQMIEGGGCSCANAAMLAVAAAMIEASFDMKRIPRQRCDLE